MTTALTSETKNEITLTAEERNTGLTWDQADFSWDDASGTWDVPGTPITKEAKNTTSMTYEAEN